MQGQRSGAPSFSVDYRIRAGDVDRGLRLQFGGVARYVQDVATGNLVVSTFGSHDPIRFVRRTIIDVVEPVSRQGTVSLERWYS
jgi:acyl-ACP thioesterase